MGKLIRKISLGTDYKTAMHYSVGQGVFDDHKIVEIVEEKYLYLISIEKEGVIKPWKEVNKNVAVTVEFDLRY